MKTEKRYAIVTETMTYRIEFDAPVQADMDELDDLAREEWDANPGRRPIDYTCEVEVEEGSEDPITAMWVYATKTFGGEV